MKNWIALMLVGLLTFQVAWMSPASNPYDNPYNQIQYVQEYKALSLDAPTPVDYTGDKDFAARASLYNFTDVSGANKIAAAQLAVFDIAKGQGNKKFGGNQGVTNIEAIIMLVRMFASDAQLKQQVLTNNPGVTADKIAPFLNDAYYGEAKRLGILTANEEVSYAKLVSRETLGVWLVRAAGLTATFNQNGLYKAVDWQSIKTENLAAVETLVDLGIMKLDANNKFNPRGSMNRQTFALMLDQAFEQFSETLGIEMRYGIVVGKKDTVDPTGTTTDIYLRNIDNTISHVQVKKPRTGVATGLVVYKNALTTQASLGLGDEVEYIVKDGVVRLTTVLAPGQVKSRLLLHFKGLPDTVSRQGIIKAVTPERLVVNGLNQTNTRIRIENDDDTMVDLLSVMDNNMLVQNQFIVVNGLGFMVPASLKNESRITYVTQGDKILYATIGKSEIVQVKGTMRYVDLSQSPVQIVFFDDKSALRTYNVAKNVSISVNYYAATLKDLKPGAPSYFTVLNNEIVSIVSDSFQPMAGYIPENGKIRMATVQYVSGSKVQFKGDSRGYEIGPATGVYKDNRNVGLTALKVGDQVKLYFDNIYSNMPTKVIIEGKEQLITKILRGQVYSFNQFTNQLSVSNRTRLQNTLWISEVEPTTQAYKLAPDALITDNGKVITSEALGKSYIQKQAYFVIRDNFGSKEIIQLVFSSGAERNFKDGVKSFSNVLNRMVLKDNRTIAYDDNTIFIQNQRLVDKTVLKTDGTIHAVTNVVNGSDVARVVRVMGNVDTIFDRVVVGALDEVYSYSFNLANFSVPSDYNWTKTDQGQKLLTMSDDTSIFNLTTGKPLTREALFNGAFSRSENDSKDGKGLAKERYYGVYVTSGEPTNKDLAIGMAIRFKEFIKNDNIDDTLTSEVQIGGKLDSILKTTTYSMGVIGEMDNEWKRLGLVDSANFLRFHGEWVENSTITFVELKEAIIVKGNQVISYEDLKVDDVVYIVRDDEDALVVFVEE